MAHDQDTDASDELRLAEVACLLDARVASDQSNQDVLDQSVDLLQPGEIDELQRLERVMELFHRARQSRDETQVRANSVQIADDSTHQAPKKKADHVPLLSSDELPTELGRFEILDVLGQGGFARVFLARDPQLDRQVALKVPLPETLSDDRARRRFQREAQAAALLSHPSIVPIFETGSLGPVSFIAYAYCPGATLAKWFADQGRRIPASTAAAIVAKLAEAVEHAHKRGVVHRDLKPGNVLLEQSRLSLREWSGSGSHAITASGLDQLEDDHSFRNSRGAKGDIGIASQVRITDFGLARLDAYRDETLTIEGSVVGTPAYMSPELARGESDVGPASDLFSLGAILYELLTGARPFRRQTHLATLRAIEHEEPTPLRQVQSAIPKDLESVCLKCLRKSPEDRYPSAYELSADLERWLQAMPVQARPATTVERLAAWRRRNPALATVTAVALVTFVAGIAGTTWQWRRATKNLAQSQAQFARAERMASFLGSTYRSADPREDGRDAKVVDVLARAEQEIAAEFADDDEARWRLLHQIGGSFTSHGMTEKALALLLTVRKERLESNAPETRQSIQFLYDLSLAHNQAGDLESAMSVIEEAYRLAVDELGTHSELALRMLAWKAAILQNQGQRSAAIELWRQVVAAMDVHEKHDRVELLGLRTKLGAALRAKGDYDEAAVLLEDTAVELERLEGPDHPSTLSAKAEYLSCLQKQGRLDDIVRLRGELLEANRRVMGNGHPQTLISMSNLASSMVAVGRREEAVLILEECIAISRQTFDDNSPYVMMPTYLVANIYRDLGELETAQARYEMALPAFRESLGATHPQTLKCAKALADLLEKTDQIAAATELRKQFKIK